MILILMLVFTTSAYAITFTVVEKVDISNIMKITTEKLTELKDSVLDNFPDAKKGAWYLGSISKLYGLDIINGYPDGTFKPNGTITRGEFTKMLVYSKDYEGIETNDTHWAAPVREKAIELGWLEEGEFLDLNKNITRLEMASMITRVSGETVEDLETYSNSLTDFSSISDTELRQEALTSYGLGIVAGYPDQTFRPEETATRAEASAMLIRLLDTNEREKPLIEENLGEAREFQGKIQNPREVFNDYSTNESETLDQRKIDYISMDELPAKVGDWIIYDIKIEKDKIFINQKLRSTGKPVDIVLYDGNYRVRQGTGRFEDEIYTREYPVQYVLDEIKGYPEFEMKDVEYILLLADHEGWGNEIMAVKNPLYEGGGN